MEWRKYLKISIWTAMVVVFIYGFSTTYAMSQVNFHFDEDKKTEPYADNGKCVQTVEKPEIEKWRCVAQIDLLGYKFVPPYTAKVITYDYGEQGMLYE